MELEKSFNQATTIRIADIFLRTKNLCFKDDNFRDTYNDKRTDEEKSQLLKSSAIMIYRGFTTYFLSILDDILPRFIAKHTNDIWAKTYIQNQYHATQETMKLAEVCANVIHTLPQEQKDFFLKTLRKEFNKEDISQSDATTTYNFGLRETGGLATRAFRL